MQPFVLNVLKTIKKYEMLQPGERLVVAVSGGADSMALLHVLWDLRREFHLSLVVAHLNHGLRPEGEEEKSFVRKASADLGIPFITRQVDIRAKQKEQRLTLQEAAREARYSFLLEAAMSQKAAKIALGHTADDQAESMIMRILRGSGTRGLSGIPPVRGDFFIRPLIESWREEIEAFLFEKKVAFLTDPTNRSLKFLRNRIRHDLLPVLEQYNPRLRQTLAQMADLFRAEEACWQNLLEERFPALVRNQKKESITLDIPSLLAQSLPIRLRSFRYAIEKILGHLRRVGFNHILTIENILQSPDPNKTLKLPQGLCVAKAYRALTFAKSLKEIIPFEYSVSGEGCLEIPEIGREMRFKMLATQAPRIRPQNISNIALLDFDDIDFPLTVRSFRPGDRLQPLGMEGAKKVKDLFIDCKIPAPQRKRIPLLFKEDQLLWVAGVRLDHRIRLKPETKKALRVELL
ncbi:MAG: tRNA lysidine(34) synthetase TilS [Deltaproteobacteria bacterium]|nr:tRNA lysidine(34) synthetase TilS [Deltaproteobacteria bacterium]